MIERRLMFTVAGRRYATGLTSILEVIRLEPCAWIPNAGRAVLGIMNFRGQSLPVADGALLLGFSEPCAEGEDARILVAAHPGLRDTPVGIRVERILGIRGVDPASLRSRDALAGRGTHPAVTGIEQVDGKSVMHLDLACLLGKPESEGA